MGRPLLAEAAVVVGGIEAAGPPGAAAAEASEPRGVEGEGGELEPPECIDEREPTRSSGATEEEAEAAPAAPGSSSEDEPSTDAAPSPCRACCGGSAADDEWPRCEGPSCGGSAGGPRGDEFMKARPDRPGAREISDGELDGDTARRTEGR